MNQDEAAEHLISTLHLTTLNLYTNRVWLELVQLRPCESTKYLVSPTLNLNTNRVGIPCKYTLYTCTLRLPQL